MLNDIKQTPECLKKLLNSYIQQDYNIKNIKISIDPVKIKKIYIIASGSSRNAASTAKIFLEKTTALPVIINFAGEFSPDANILDQCDLIIALSQSGETADVISALKRVQLSGINSFAITNYPESTLFKMADSGMLINAGKEESIPATKSFSCQLMSLYILGLYLAEKRKSYPQAEINHIAKKLYQVSDFIFKEMEDLKQKASILADKIKNSKEMIILGKGQNYGLAEEASLKIQETCYVNAFAYPTGEFMHGHLAAVDEKTTVISILTEFFGSNKINVAGLKNTNEIKTKRNPYIIKIGHGFEETEKNTDVYVKITKKEEIATPFLTNVFLQLLAYKTAVLLENDTKTPRSLTKVVMNE